jgi:hypothetical protein
MNLEQLARHYDKLTPQERIPLIVAAAARDDEVEQARLAGSARRADYRVPDYWPFARGLFDLVQFYLLKQMDLAAAYWRTVAVLQRAAGACDGPSPAASREELLRDLRFAAYRSLVLAEAWHIFCAEWQLDPKALPILLPGYENLELLLKLAEPIAFTTEEALNYLREKLQICTASKVDESAAPVVFRIETAADVARSFHDYLSSGMSSRG